LSRRAATEKLFASATLAKIAMPAKSFIYAVRYVLAPKSSGHAEPDFV
jgi:hypothetical protein